jgi:hypothetical protein
VLDKLVQMAGKPPGWVPYMTIRLTLGLSKPKMSRVVNLLEGIGLLEVGQFDGGPHYLRPL